MILEATLEYNRKAHRMSWLQGDTAAVSTSVILDQVWRGAGGWRMVNQLKK